MTELQTDPLVLAADQPEQAGHRALLHGRVHDTAGRLEAAAACYEQAARDAESGQERGILVEALRRLGVVRHRCEDPARGRELCAQSYREAVALGDLILAGEALNALAGFEFEAGHLAAARIGYVNALALAGSSQGLLGRIEQNLGIIDSVQGEHDGAFAHYRRALEAFRQIGDESGCAIATHNLGVTASRRGDLEEAERSLTKSAAIAIQLGDSYLRGLCELHRAEVSHARQLYGDALTRAETALDTFERLGDRRSISAAYRVIGKVLRDSGRTVLAEDRLRTALRLAAESEWVLGQAEASRELGRLHQSNGKKQQALAFFREAYDLFGRLAARVDIRDVAQRISELAA
ncbi:MAG TPA: tetratricopeptide repeat protein [Gemmatimonadales bacterium]|jgi:tetratricopeptide (TPR) repeat protein